MLANARARAVNQVFNQPNTYVANANLSQTLFQGGRVFASWRAARRVREAARLTAGETRADVAVGVMRAYLEAALADRVEHIRGENVQLASQRVEQAERLFTAGRVARYDVLRFRVERANLEPLVIEARNSPRARLARAAASAQSRGRRAGRADDDDRFVERHARSGGRGAGR